MLDAKRGRPNGAWNKNPLKDRAPAVPLKPNSFEAVVLPSMRSRRTNKFDELLHILETSVQRYWTDERLLASFATNEAADDMENKCHFYSSSKGKLVVDDGNLHTCSLFPHIAFGVEFLEQYLHSYEDVANYADYIHDVSQSLRQRARELQKKQK